MPGAKPAGIKLCSSEDEVRQAAKTLLGKRLVTHQTGPEGRVVHRLYVEAAVPIERELYLGLVLDRKTERIMIVAHPQGGMEIEEIARSAPDSILREVGGARHRHELRSRPARSPTGWGWRRPR